MQLSTYKNFTYRRIVAIPEIRVTLHELVHEKSGAEVMYLAADDDENFFNISFRTIADTSNGVAHILEHTVLCGSEKYPVRDPFFSMNRRSLNTFMNAFTGADFTCYPASSCVPQDFYNLLEVYIDAVFHPRLTKMSFLQEGHRLEWTKGDDPTSPLTIKGVVYNEMKGALANVDTRLNEAVMQALFPDLTYGIISGGSPEEIPDLTHEELIAFHRKFYHPSRALFFFYGNLPLEKHLDFLEEKILKEAENLPPLPPLALQKRFTKKVTKTLSYPIASDEEVKNNTHVAFSWLTCSILEQEEVLALNVIDLLLMGTDASPLKMALLKSNLCASCDSSLEDELSEVPFVIACKGCPKESGQKLENVIFKTLEEIISTGFSLDLVEGAIHQLEFSRTEISSPFGLALYFRSALLKHHGGNPEDGLKVHTLFKNLRKKVQDPKYLLSLIQKHFIDNPHFVRIVMHPDVHLEAKEKELEEKKIKEIEKKLTDQERLEIVKQTQELALYQEKTESLDVLPKVTLKDVPKNGKEFFLIEEKVGTLSLYCHPTFTNEIVYLDLGFDLPYIDPKDHSLLRLFANLLAQVGMGGRSYVENLDYIFKHTGGIACDLDLFFQAEDPHAIRPSLVFRSKALYRKADKLFEVLCDMATSADFTDTERLKELLIQHFEELETSVQNSPLRYAMQLGASSISKPLTLRNKWFGLDYFWTVKEVLHDFEKGRFSFVEKMQEFQKILMPLEKADLVLSCDEKMYYQMKKERFYGLEALKFKTFEPWKNDFEPNEPLSQGRIVASPVAFTTMIFPSVGYLDEASPTLSVASKIMENKVLHRKIREQGGAYGSGAAHVPMSGHFYFYSYRDPHVKTTLEAFLEAVKELAQGHFEPKDVEEAKLGILQELDSPIAPGSRGFIAYERLRSKRMPTLRQHYRQKLLAVESQAIQKAVQKELSEKIKKAVVVSFGGKKLLEDELKGTPVFDL